jgi:hypothetical protein
MVGREWKQAILGLIETIALLTVYENRHLGQAYALVVGLTMIWRGHYLRIISKTHAASLHFMHQ